MDMHGAELRTPGQRRHGLARIQQACRVEGCLEIMELPQFCIAELHAHLVDLLHAHTVFPGYGPTDGDAGLQDGAPNRSAVSNSPSRLAS